jgi:hypothetical protein
MSLADILEGAASALPDDADSIRPANGDPFQLLAQLGADGAERVLVWLLSNEPEAGAELALAWLEVDGGPEVLGSLDESRLPKPGRKALRRALHHLRARGLAVPERPPAEVVSRLPPVESEFRAGYVSALDPRGSRLVYLVEPNPAGGARLFEILLDEARGIVDFEVYSAGRSRIRRFLKDAVQRTRFPAVEAPPAALRALVARIAEQHPADRVLPASFSEWRMKVAVPGETPGDLAAAALEQGADAESLARAAELVRKGSLGPWGPPALELSRRLEQPLEAAAAGTPGQEDMGALAAALFDARSVEIQAQRFRESAFVLWKLEREEDARSCLAAALALASKPPAENPVAIAMTETLLTPVLDGLRARRARDAAASESET